MVLVEKRRVDDEADPGFVLLPGGHVERSESFEDALRREMREELGIRVLKLAPIDIHYHLATDGEKQRVHYFHVRKWNGIIRSMEADRVYWESRLSSLSDVMERRIVRKLLNRVNLDVRPLQKSLGHKIV